MQRPAHPRNLKPPWVGRGALDPAAAAAGTVSYTLLRLLGSFAGSSALALARGGVVLLGGFLLTARAMRISDLNALFTTMQTRFHS